MIIRMINVNLYSIFIILFVIFRPIINLFFFILSYPWKGCELSLESLTFFPLESQIIIIRQYECIQLNLLLIINNYYLESMSRIPRIRTLLTEQIIEELLAKFILNLEPKQQTEERLAYHFRLAYYNFFDKFHIKQQVETNLLIQEEVFFMKKVNEYLPDFIRVQACAIPMMHYNASLVPVYGAIISRDNKKEYLLVQDKRTGKYGFCKGKISEEETPQDCVTRQVMEEIGLKIRTFGKHIDILLGNGKSYTFLEVEVHEDHHAQDDITYEQHRQITKLVWWPLKKIRQVCSHRYNGNQQLNAPTKKAFQQLLGRWNRQS